jgi:hypothetical protein
MFKFKTFLFFTLLIALASCERPQDPQNNIIQVSFASISSKGMVEIPATLEFSLTLGSKIKSPNFKIIKNTEGKNVESNNLVWNINYPDLEANPLGNELKIFSTQLGAGKFINIFQGELAAKSLDIEFIPFSKKILFTIQDNPSTTRTFADATGAKLGFYLQRKLLDSNSVDRPKKDSLRQLSEEWWLTDKTQYDEYKEYCIVSTALIKGAFGAGAHWSEDLRSKLGAEKLNKFKTKIVSYTKLKLRQKKKSNLLAALNRNSHEFAPTKAELFWDYLNTDSAADIFKSYFLKKTIVLSESIFEKAGQSTVGDGLKKFLEKEIQDDDKKLNKIYQDTVDLLTRE